MNKTEALDIIAQVKDVVSALTEAKNDDEVGDVLVDALSDFKSMHPLEKDSAYLYLLGRVVDATKEGRI